MWLQINHFSDTIWYYNYWKPGITVQRLTIWYEQIASKLWIKYDNLNFVWSKFWESYQTWAIALKYLYDLWNKNITTQVLFVNNASRAKYKNSKEAKWSDCLIAEIVLNWIKHYIVWVDNDVFNFFNEFQKLEKWYSKWIKINIVKWINYNDWNLNIIINDLSKWTQFRSKEHFPLVQLLVIKELYEKWFLDLGKWVTWLKFETFNKTNFNSIQVKNNILLWLLSIKSYKNIIFEKKYINSCEWIEKIINLWEFYLLKDKLWIICDKNINNNNYKENLCSLDIVDKYSKIRESLEKNQIVLIHIDLFWNGFFATSLKLNNWEYNWIEDGILLLCKELWLELWENIKIFWWWVEFEVIITKTISDYTWKNCLWNSSARWPKWEILLNINKSIDVSWEILEEIQKLPIWTILNIEKISK